MNSFLRSLHSHQDISHARHAPFWNTYTPSLCRANSPDKRTPLRDVLLSRYLKGNFGFLQLKSGFWTAKWCQLILHYFGKYMPHQSRLHLAGSHLSFLRWPNVSSSPEASLSTWWKTTFPPPWVFSCAVGGSIRLHSNKYNRAVSSSNGKKASPVASPWTVNVCTLIRPHCFKHRDIIQ